MERIRQLTLSDENVIQYLKFSNAILNNFSIFFWHVEIKIVIDFVSARLQTYFINKVK